MKIKVILGSTREKRQGERIARFVASELQKVEGVEAELLDLKDYPLPFYEYDSLPFAISDNYPNEVASRWVKKIDEADGFIIVTPEYNHGYSAVLKNALDYGYKEWNRKAVAFVSYGGIAGGARAVEQLRQVIGHLQMANVSEAMHIPFVNSFTDSDDNQRRIKGLFEQLFWWTRALKTARES